MTALYGIPSWLLLIIAVGLFVGVACTGQILVRRAFGLGCAPAPAHSLPSSC